jgi:hypothetical protein
MDRLIALQRQKEKEINMNVEAVNPKTVLTNKQISTLVELG